MPERERKEVVSVRMRPADVNALCRHALRCRESVGAVVRRAILRLLRDEDGGKRNT